MGVGGRVCVREGGFPVQLSIKSMLYLSDNREKMIKRLHSRMACASLTENDFKQGCELVFKYTGKHT